MAIFQSTGIAGFIASALKTGKQDEEGKPIYVENFLSGFAGWGWKIWKTVAGFFRLEIDELVVRRTMTVFELLIQKIRAIVGAQAITQGNGKIKGVELSEDGTTYLLTPEENEISIVEHDFIRCQVFGGGQRFYHVEVASVEGGVIRVPTSEFAGSSLPLPGDEMVQFGNSSHDPKYAGRHSAIYMHTDESGQPAIDVMFDIYSKSWEGCTKVRIGGDIPGSGGLKGFYCENGMIKGVNTTGHTVYCIYPDGSAMFGDGSTKFNTDLSGHIAGGAISWQWDNDKKRYVCTMKGVVLTWDNLDDETKENLKGEPGKPGLDGNPGYDGSDGDKGDCYKNVYRNALYKPATPTGNTPPEWRSSPDVEDIVISHASTFNYVEGFYVSPLVSHNSITKNRVSFTTHAPNQVIAVELFVSSEPSYDCALIGLLDNENVTSSYNYLDKISGEGSKIIYVNVVLPGEHFFDVAYSKDSSTSRGSDNCKYRILKVDKCWISTSVFSGVTDSLIGEWSDPVTFIGDTADMENIYILQESGICSENTPFSDPYINDYIPQITLDIYDGETNYQVGAKVRNGTLFYQAIQDGLGRPLTDEEYWKVIPGWTDNPSGASEKYPYEFVSSRKKKESIWSPFSNPVVISQMGKQGKPGDGATLPEWLEKWNGYATELGEEYIVTPTMFSGTKSADGKLTGIAQGKECITIDGVKRTGIFALVDNEVVFELDPVTKKYLFRGDVYADSGVFKGFLSTLFTNVGSHWPSNIDLISGMNLIGDCVGGVVYLPSANKFPGANVNILVKSYFSDIAIPGKPTQRLSVSIEEDGYFYNESNFRFELLKTVKLNGKILQLVSIPDIPEVYRWYILNYSEFIDEEKVFERVIVEN